jgi:hypothetical protein
MVKANEVVDYVDATRPVKVYWNLHKNCLSVQQDGLVKCHADGISLKNFKTVVNASGRDRVRRENRKNVHAFIKGNVYLKGERPLPFPLCPLAYNPYKDDHWIEKETGKHVDSGEHVQVINRKVLAFGFTYLETREKIL